MIVLAGGTGRLGRILVDRIGGHGERLRVLSRDPGRAGRSVDGEVEVVTADVRDREAVDRALTGARVVISAMSAFGMKGVAPRQVDFEGNANLIGAAEKCGAERFIFVSALGASADHPMDLARMKHLAEGRLRASKLSWTILRPSTFIETFQEVVCAPLLKNGKAVVFGRAENPINFVSAHDVAGFVELALSDPSLSGKVVEIGGRENLSLLQFVDTFCAATGVTGPVKHIPRLAMRLMSHLARPFNPTFARMAQAGVLMDTTDMTFDATQLVDRYPQFALTTAAGAARRDYGSRVASSETT
jgi:NADH dehydrogenase